MSATLTRLRVFGSSAALLVPVLFTTLAFFLLAQDAPGRAAPTTLRTYLGNLRRPETL